MKHSKTLTLLVLPALVIAHHAFADIITVEGKIMSVNANGRTISIEIEGASKEFDVSSKAKVRIDGMDAKLDSLKEEQKVSLSYHDQLDIVMKIDAYSDSIDWINLFNGNDLQGWRFGSPETPLNSNSSSSKRIDGLWFVDAERKVLVSQGKETCWLETDKTFKNFRLRCEWRFLSGRKVTDSGGGIVVRTNGKNLNGRNPRGIEIDLLPSEMPGLGSFMLYGTPLESKEGKAIGEQNVRLKRIREPKVNPEGQWNKCEVRCEDDRIEVTINGAVVNEAWGAREEFGTICLRNQSSELEYRNVQLFLLDSIVIKNGEPK